MRDAAMQATDNQNASSVVFLSSTRIAPS